MPSRTAQLAATPSPPMLPPFAKSSFRRIRRERTSLPWPFAKIKHAHFKSHWKSCKKIVHYLHVPSFVQDCSRVQIVCFLWRALLTSVWTRLLNESSIKKGDNGWPQRKRRAGIRHRRSQLSYQGKFLRQNCSLVNFRNQSKTSLAHHSTKPSKSTCGWTQLLSSASKT